MKRTQALGDAHRLKDLAQRLERVPAVARYSTDEEKEGWTLAHSFADLEESFIRFLDEHLPKLIGRNLTAEQVNEQLLEIGEELRHILYHIRDAEFYKYLHAGDSLEGSQ